MRTKSATSKRRRNTIFTKLSVDEQAAMLLEVHMALIDVLKKHRVVGSTDKYSLYKGINDAFIQAAKSK